MPRPVEDRSNVGGAAQFNNIGPVPLSIPGPVPLSIPSLTISGLSRFPIPQDRQHRRLEGDASGLEGAVYEGRHPAVLLARLAQDPRPGQALLWDMATGEEMLTLEKQSGRVRQFQFSPDGKALAATFSADKGSMNLQIWHAGDDEPQPVHEPGPVDQEPCADPDTDPPRRRRTDRCWRGRCSF